MKFHVILPMKSEKKLLVHLSRPLRLHIHTCMYTYTTLTHTHTHTYVERENLYIERLYKYGEEPAKVRELVLTVQYR